MFVSIGGRRGEVVALEFFPQTFVWSPSRTDLETGELQKKLKYSGIMNSVASVARDFTMRTNLDTRIDLSFWITSELQ